MNCKCDCGREAKILIINKKTKTIDCPECGRKQVKTHLFKTGV